MSGGEGPAKPFKVEVDTLNARIDYDFADRKEALEFARAQSADPRVVVRAKEWLDKSESYAEMLGVVKAQDRALHDVIQECEKQEARFPPAHDDQHADEALAAAAAYLAFPDEGHPDIPAGGVPHPEWAEAIVRKHPRRQHLVIAAALLVAEIKRRDRAASTVPTSVHFPLVGVRLKRNGTVDYKVEAVTQLPQEIVLVKVYSFESGPSPLILSVDAWISELSTGSLA